MPDVLTPTWAALRNLTDDLMVKRGALAELLMEERRQRMRSVAASGEGSVSARDREADMLTVELSTDIIDAKLRIAALEDMRDLLTLAITHGVELV